MYITNNKYRIARLDLSNLQKSANLLAQQFLGSNKVWGNIKPSKQQTYHFMYMKTKEMLEWEQELREQGIMAKDVFLNFVYLNNNDQIVGVATAFQLTQYLKKKSKVYLSQFDLLQSYGQQLQKDIDKKDTLPGLSVYGMFSALQPQIAGKGLALLFWLDMGHYMHSHGFRRFFGRCSNIKSYKLLMNSGGQQISKIKVFENNRVMTLSFVKWPLMPISYASHIVNKYKLKASL